LTTPLAGIYTVQITDTLTGCVATDEVIVLEDTDLPSAIIYADPDSILDCTITSLTLSSDNEPDVVYSWNTVISQQIIIVEPGPVNLIAIDTISGCENTNQIVINDFLDYPLIDLDSPDTISCYEPSITIDGTGSQTGPNIVYNWLDQNNNLIPNQNGNTLLVDAGGWYYLQLTDEVNGCENIDSVFVESILTVPLSQGMQDISLFCGETSTTLDPSIIGSPADLLINWSTSNGNIVSGSTSLNPLVDASGNYIVTIQDATSGCITIDSVEVIINSDVPEFVIANVLPEECDGDEDGQIIISSVSGGTPNYSFSINGQNTNSTGQFSNLPSGLYNIEITDANGCQMDTVFTINPGINLELDLPSILQLVEGQGGLIQALTNVSVDDLSTIQWNPTGILSCDTCLTTTIQSTGDATFQLTIIHNNGCIATAVINIIVIPETKVFIPNAFSPNGDGMNDYFTLFANDQVVEILELSIFDRWGEHVFQQYNFEPNVPVIGWDGRFRGRKVPNGVYIYFAEIRFADGTTEIFRGDVTLLR